MPDIVSNVSSGLLFMEGFDHWDTGSLANAGNGKWNNIYISNTAATIESGTGRFGGNCLRWQGGFAATFLMKMFPYYSTTWIVGVAVKPLSGGDSIMCWNDGAIATQWGLYINSDLTLSITRSATALTNFLTGTTKSTVAIPLNQWSYLEWKMTVGTNVPSGSCVLVLNGNSGLPIISISGQSTQQGSAAGANSLYIGHPLTGNNSTQLFDDIYVCDGTGPPPYNNFLGNCKVETHLPVSGSALAGNSMWAGSGVSTPLAAIQQPYHSGDKAFIYTSGAAQISTFIMPPLQNTPKVIYGVQTNLTAKKDAAGARIISAELVSSGVTYRGDKSPYITASYQVYNNVWHVDPNTGLPWTIQAVDSIECGIQNI